MRVSSGPFLAFSRALTTGTGWARWRRYPNPLNRGRHRATLFAQTSWRFASWRIPWRAFASKASWGARALTPLRATKRTQQRLLLRWPVVLAFRSCLEGRDCRVFKNTRTRFSRVLDCIHYYCKRVLYIYKKIIKVQPSRILLKRGRRFFLKMTRWRSYEGHAQEKANNVTESAAVAGAPLPHACPCPCPPWAAAPPARLTSTLLLRPVVPVPRPSSHAARVQRRDGRGHARSAHQRRRQWQLLHLRGRRARAGHDRPPLPSHARTHPSA